MTQVVHTSRGLQEPFFCPAHTKNLFPELYKCMKIIEKMNHTHQFFILIALAVTAPLAEAQTTAGTGFSVRRAGESLVMNDSARTIRLRRSLPDSIRSIPVRKGHYTFATIIDGDTVPLYQIKEINVYAGGMLLTKKEIQQNPRLIRNVRLMLPYAQEGKRRLDALEIEIAALPKKQRKQAIKKAEEDLLRDYKGELSNYTFSQGLVLIKLIDRETNRTAYNIVGELRGSLRAGLYQTLAKLFGYNLKDTFDPKRNKKDDLIDRICTSIERGQL